MIAFVGMETSGMIRRAFQDRGIETYSCDNQPAQDDGEEMAYRDGLPIGRHLVGDVFEALDHLWSSDLWPEAAVFHPDCTYLTNSAAWAFNDPDFERYPGVGYHQRVKPGTKTGAARRAAREIAVADALRIRALKIRRIVIENPIGHLSSELGPATQIVQPYQFGADASKGTCLWVYEDGELLRPQQWLPILAKNRRPGRVVRIGDKLVERWANQTDSGQNRLSPSDERAMRRSDTYPGIAEAIAERIVHDL